ncbi:MAG: DNA/RNA non-specific endonuclease [Atopobiaceae bacterium]|nr:DNA/RNA non-specific endonuclease [Atopobiaceae bacterium]
MHGRSMIRHRRLWRGGMVVVALAMLCMVLALARLVGVDPVGLFSAPSPTEVPAATTALVPRAWDEAAAPNYYEVVGPSRFGDLFVGEAEPDRGEVRYGALDALGRATGVLACVDAAFARAGSARERGDTSGIHPSGWGHNEEVEIELPTGRLYHGYFWNRSHLLAKSLGGEEIEQNLVCGTRMQNVGANLNGTEGGMAYAETLVRNWLADNPDGFVYYAATPCYAGEELVCQNVIVDVLSSDGALDLEVVVYNAAKGYQIDYATGEFRAS